MNADTVFELLEIVLSMAQDQNDGTQDGELAVTNTLADIIHKAIDAYEEHTGMPVDLALVPAEARL